MQRQSLRELVTAGQVIDVIGAKRLAHLTNRALQHVSNWRASGRLAAFSFLIVNAELKRLGYRANPALWGISNPKVSPPVKSQVAAHR